MFRTSKIYLVALSLALSAFLSAAAVAQTTPAPAAGGNKIGIVNIQDAIVNTNEGKKEFEALQQRFGPRNNELKTQNDEVEKLKTQLQAQQEKLSEEARSAQVKNISDKQKVLQRSAEDFQAEVQAAEQDVVNRLGQKMIAVLEKYANANGFAVVLDVSNPQTPVLWAAKTTNLTKELVDAYNVDFPSAAPSAAGPAATKPAASATKPAGATTPKKP
ncbi:MAG TPA: OmpH family outer membrane protein [Candidatus Saccharimonadales bacterium]|jgi:outer membrane protein|nr:OmpH family outer membrane protein [Candidatus Saccharimonadales bacterium]